MVKKVEKYAKIVEGIGNTKEKGKGETKMLEEIERYFERGTGEEESKERKKEKFYKKLESEGVNLSELKRVLEEKEDMLVVSGAGVGKTTTLALELIKGKYLGEQETIKEIKGQECRVASKVLVCTFLRTGAEDIEKKVKEWKRRLGLEDLDMSNIKYSTIHAEVYDAIKSMGVPVKILEDTQKVLKTVMAKYDIKRLREYEDIKDMEGLISYTRNRLDEKRYENEVMRDFGLNKKMLIGLLEDTKKMRKVLGGMDFEDMQEMLLDVLPRNENVANFIRGRYDYIYVDEFQDTSQLQYEILKYYFEGAKRVVCVGDDDQTIYSWRGSDVDIITKRYVEDYNPKIHKLTTNYRCRGEILKAVLPSIEKNINRHKKELKWVKEGGEVRVEEGKGVGTLRTNILKDLGEGLTVGVLGRTNNDLMLPALLLEIEGGVNFNISKGVRVTNQMTKLVWGLMELVLKRWGENHEYYLRQIMPREAKNDINILSNVLKTNKGYSIYTLDWADIKSSLTNSTLKNFLYNIREYKERRGDREVYKYILSYLGTYVYSEKRERTSEYVRKMRELIGVTEDLIYKEGGKYKEESLEWVMQELLINVPERVIQRIKYEKESKVKLTTVHEAKGKEWGSVYIWNNIKGTFPKRVDGLELSPEGYEEERRVHYIAWTRAKDRLTIYTEKGAEGEFLRECSIKK